VTTNNVFEISIFGIKYSREQNSGQDNSWIANIRLTNIVGSIKNNTLLNLQFDLEIIPKGSSTESDHFVGLVDGWSIIERT
jgi:hypothetical protein